MTPCRDLTRADPGCVDRPVEPVSGVLDQGIGGLRIASCGRIFPRRRVGGSAGGGGCGGGGTGREPRLSRCRRRSRARSAAYVITTTEGAALHLERLRTRPDDFDPDVRDRLIAGALVPAAAVVQAQKFRRWFRTEMLRLFQEVDAILAPATPSVAPFIGQKTFVLNGKDVPLRPNIGIYTQPISFIGLPVVAVPVPTAAGLPIGVQIITPPWREDVALRIARALEASGAARAPVQSGAERWRSTCLK